MKSASFATMESIGTSLLMLVIYPRLDLVRSLLLMNTISFMPSLFRLILELLTFQYKKSNYLLYYHLFNSMAVLMQFSVLIITSLNDNLFNQINNWILPVSLTLISLSQSKDYIQSLLNLLNSKVKNKYINHLKFSLDNLHSTRYKLGLFVNLYKIGLTFLVYYLYNQEFYFSFHNLIKNKNSIYLTMCCIQISSFLVFFWSSSLAYKLKMHRWSYFLPLMLITPIAILLSVVLCDQSVKIRGFDYFKNYYLCTSFSFTVDPFRWQLIVGILVWWLSNMWMFNFIWQNNSGNNGKRTFKFQDLNVIFMETSLVLNSYKKSLLNNEKMDSNEKVSNNKTQSLIYICATMWHENNHEMLQLLKSIMRYLSYFFFFFKIKIYYFYKDLIWINLIFTLMNRIYFLMMQSFMMTIFHRNQMNLFRI
jgi:chitin synthase